MELNDRKKKVLTAIIDEYIKTGEPVGSKRVSNLLSLSVSSATVRNDMALLEKCGFLEQPHTSSGRIPSYTGYRLYIQEYMKPDILTQSEKDMIDNLLEYHNFTLDNVIDNGLDILSELTGCTVVASIETLNYSVITRVEVIPAGKRLYVLLLITSSGSVKNKVCRVQFDLLDEHINYFSKIIEDNLFGVNINELNRGIIEKLTLSLGSYMLVLAPFLKVLSDIVEDISSKRISIKGENKLLCMEDLRSQEIVEFFSNKKNNLSNLLSSAFEGVHVIFGNENDEFIITNSSLIMSKYKFSEKKSGSFGVIGPIRLDYSKVIPYVEYFSEKVSKLLSSSLEDGNLEGEFFNVDEKTEKRR